MTTKMQRPGGRTQKTREAVLDAAFEVVAESGYHGLTVEAISDRSGVHKTTIYRRWSTIDDVLLDAVLTRAREAIPLERTDDPIADLVSMGGTVAANLVDPISRAAAAAALSGPDSERFAELNQRFWSVRIEEASTIVVEAQRSGIMDSDREPGEVIESIVGPIWFRSMVMHRPVDDRYIESLVNEQR